MSHKSQRPIRMWKREQGNSLTNERCGKYVRAMFKVKFVKLRWKPGVVSMVLFSSVFMAFVMQVRVSSISK